MNNTSRLVTPITHAAIAHHGLRVWHRSVELVRAVSRSPIGEAELRSQALRAATSCALNIAEGAALLGAAKRRHYRIALGSVCETLAAYEIAEALGESRRDDVLDHAVAIAAMLRRLSA